MRDGWGAHQGLAPSWRNRSSTILLTSSGVSSWPPASVACWSCRGSPARSEATSWGVAGGGAVGEEGVTGWPPGTRVTGGRLAAGCAGDGGVGAAGLLDGGGRRLVLGQHPGRARVAPGEEDGEAADQGEHPADDRHPDPGLPHLGGLPPWSDPKRGRGDRRRAHRLPLSAGARPAWRTFTKKTVRGPRPGGGRREPAGRGGRPTTSGASMFLRSLTLKGFKSSPRRPLSVRAGSDGRRRADGSGKPNVVDEGWRGRRAPSGPARRRSTEIVTVIFAGSGRRLAVGRAQASLTIHYTGGVPPIHFTEVTITRTLPPYVGEKDEVHPQLGVPCSTCSTPGTADRLRRGPPAAHDRFPGPPRCRPRTRPPDRRLIIEEAAGVSSTSAGEGPAPAGVHQGRPDPPQDLLREVGASRGPWSARPRPPAATATWSASCTPCGRSAGPGGGGAHCPRRGRGRPGPGSAASRPG